MLPEQLSFYGLLLGSGVSSGLNLYLTIAGLGIAHRLAWLQLPGELGFISHKAVIIVALILFLIEWIADKIPVVDSFWDSVHTFIRPFGGFILAYMAMTDVEPAIQIVVSMVVGTVALSSHLTKATSRVLINSSPEPVSNTVVSLAEDTFVMTLIFFIIKYPLFAIIFPICFIIFSIWFLPKIGKFVIQIFRKKKSQ